MMRGYVLATALTLFVNPTWAEVTLSVIKFTNVVTINGNKQPPKPIEGSISRNKLGRLYARFTVVGNNETIKLMERTGYLSIIAEWRINGIVHETPEIGITQQRWDEGESEFRRQVEDDGVFQFRTTTLRDYIPIGNYQLTIRDGNQNALQAITIEVTE